MLFRKWCYSHRSSYLGISYRCTANISNNTDTTDIFHDINSTDYDICDCDDLYCDYPTDYYY
jgi:hypothetical protein